MDNLVVNKATLKEIAKWINEKCSIEEFNDVTGIDIDKEVTAEDVKKYLIGVMNSNLEYDFGYDFGVDD